jgi:hypothetical protein
MEMEQRGNVSLRLTPFTASLESVLVGTIVSSSDLESVRMTCLMISCYYSQSIMIPRSADRPELADPLAVTLSIPKQDMLERDHQRPEKGSQNTRDAIPCCPLRLLF